MPTRLFFQRHTRAHALPLDHAGNSEARGDLANRWRLHAARAVMFTPLREDA